MLDLQASAGLYTRLDGEHARVPVGRLKIGLIAQECKPHLTNDVLNDSRISHPDWAKQKRMVSFAGYPLLVEGRPVGVLAMFARKSLGQDTLEALGAVADTIAQGIERKRAEEKLARLNRTLRTLYQSDGFLYPEALSKVPFDKIQAEFGCSVPGPHRPYTLVRTLRCI